MNTAECVDLAKQFAENFKEQLAADRFQPVVYFYDNEVEKEPRLIFFPRLSPESRDMLPWALSVLAASIDNLTQMIFIHDSYHCTSAKTNGEAWRPGDMQYAIEHQTEDAALITESLDYLVVTADEALGICIDYKRTDEGVDLDLDGLRVMEPNGFDSRLEGAFPTAMRQAFEAPKLMHLMREQMGISPEELDLNLAEARIHSIAIGTKMVLARAQMHVLIPSRNDDERERLAYSFAHGPMSDGIKLLDQDDVVEIVDLEKSFEQPAFEKE